MLLKGKKKAPKSSKSNAERQATHKANRSEAMKAEVRASNAAHTAVLRMDKRYRLKENEITKL